MSKKSRKVTIALRGGLGNNLFQISYGLELSRLGFKIDFLWFERQSSHAYEFEKTDWILKNFPQTQGYKFRFHSPVKFFPIRILLKMLGLEEEIASPELAPELPKGRFEFGYFQKREVAKNLIPAFTDHSPTQNSDYGVIHVRGGDYLSQMNSHIGVLTSRYYRAAINELPHVRKWTVITDDEKFARALFNSISMTGMEVEFSSFGAFSDFENLRASKNKIIGNSTFALWAAYLSEPDSRIVAPEHFYKGANFDSNLYPSHWKICPSDWSV